MLLFLSALSIVNALDYSLFLAFKSDSDNFRYRKVEPFGYLNIRKDNNLINIWHFGFNNIIFADCTFWIVTSHHQTFNCLLWTKHYPLYSIQGLSYKSCTFCFSKISTIEIITYNNLQRITKIFIVILILENIKNAIYMKDPLGLLRKSLNLQLY